MTKIITLIFLILLSSLPLPSLATPGTELNHFTFKLYQKLNAPDQNLIVSPYSLSSLLIPLSMGANGETQTQLFNLFQVSSVDEIHRLQSEMLSIHASLMKPDCKDWFSCQLQHLRSYFKSDVSQFELANSFWADKKFIYKKEFLSILKNKDAFSFFTVDFHQHPERARQVINQWVFKKTHYYIKDLIPSGAVNQQTVLILANAIYFKGKWALPFKTENTQDKPFLLGEKEINVPMMSQKEEFAYMENEVLQMLLLSYQDTTLALAILLPKSPHTLSNIANALNEKMFEDLLTKTQSKEVNVQLPKFKIESNLSLNNALSSLGVDDAFNEKANFKSITDSPLVISNIIQKAVIQVDEAGTVAAAATAVMMAGTAYRPIISFNANRPFIYLIFDKPSKIIFFIGTLNNPLEE